MPTLKDEAICIRLKDWSETSQIAVMLTREHGKVSVVAKGAKRHYPSAVMKYSGGIELLTGGQGVFIVKPTTELAILTEWNLQEPFWHLRQHLGAYQRAMYAADLMYHLISDHDPHPRSYAAMMDFLQELESAAQHERGLLKFQWTVVDDMGFAPVLDHDAQSGEPMDMEQITFGFHPIEGGVVPDTGEADRWRVRRETIHLLQAVAQRGDLSEYEDAALNRANRLLCAYFRSVLSKSLMTMDYILEGV